MTGQVPDAARTWLRASAVFLVAVAAAGNVSHGAAFLSGNGQGVFLAGVGSISPDVLLLSSVIRLRYSPRHAWSWAGLVASTGFVLTAGVATAGDGVTAKLVSGWPVLVAIIAAGLMETSEADVPAGEKGYTLESAPAVEPEKGARTVDPLAVEAVLLPVPSTPRPEPVRRAVAARRTSRATVNAPTLPADVLELGQVVAAELVAAGQSPTNRALIAAFRARQVPLSSGRAQVLAQVLRTS